MGVDERQETLLTEPPDFFTKMGFNLGELVGMIGGSRIMARWRESDSPIMPPLLPFTEKTENEWEPILRLAPNLNIDLPEPGKKPPIADYDQIQNVKDGLNIEIFNFDEVARLAEQIPWKLIGENPEITTDTMFSRRLGFVLNGETRKLQAVCFDRYGRVTRLLKLRTGYADVCDCFYEECMNGKSDIQTENSRLKKVVWGRFRDAMNLSNPNLLVNVQYFPEVMMEYEYRSEGFDVDYKTKETRFFRLYH
jgi:hypothetical protein